jgi:hypothetical protein
VSAAGPPPCTRYFADGDWRSEFLVDQRSWPAAWPQLTPPKYIAQDGKSIWKFEGLGTHGSLSFLRSQTLAQNGYAPRIAGRDGGFVAYERVRGESLSYADLDDAVTEHMAWYLAFRASNFPSDIADSSEIELMSVHNVRQLLGIELHDFRLPVRQPVICDGRMMPHEWLRDENKQILKTDATSHGDNHFFPGPCDIAWDVAGSILEWRMSPKETIEFIEKYESHTGDTISERLHPYMIGYAAFQAAYAKMAWSSITDATEKIRFERDFERYSCDLKRALGHRASISAAQSI